MQTIELHVNDMHIKNVLIMLKNFKEGMIEKLEVKGDSNLEYDSCFYERQEYLHTLRDDIRSGKEKMYDFNDSMDELVRDLEK